MTSSTHFQFDAAQEQILQQYLSENSHRNLAFVKGVCFAMANSPVEVPASSWMTIALDEVVSEDTMTPEMTILSQWLEQLRIAIIKGQEVMSQDCAATVVDSVEFDNLRHWSKGFEIGNELLADIWPRIIQLPQVREMEEAWSRCTVLLSVWSRAEKLLEKASQPGGPDVEKMLEAMPAVAREMAVMCHDIQVIVKKITTKTAPIVIEERIGRNDPCSCGSGKKFKKCCG